MSFEERLKAAAEIILCEDQKIGADPSWDCSSGVSATLKPHQVDGVSWLIRRYLRGVNVILGDEMGLGKTLQAIAFLSYLKVHQHCPGPFLVLCPLSVIHGWMSEFANFCPTLGALKYIGNKESRLGVRRTVYEHVMQQLSSANVQSALPFDVLVTTYDILLLDQDFLCQVPWHYAVIDEAQRLKNPSSVLYRVLMQRFVIPRRLLLTGTPVQNNLSELWALLHFCMPSVFRTLENFVTTFNEAEVLSAGQDTSVVKERIKFLKYILRAFMLRRTKSTLVENGSLSLPSLTEITVMAPLSNLQKKLYMSILRKELPLLLSFSSGASSQRSLQNIVIQLRKACSHPYLFPGIEPEPFEEGEHLVQASGKLVILDQLLHKLCATGHRVLLFAQMTHTLDILQDFLELRDYTYERLDGSVRAEERFAAIRSFSQSAEDDLKTPFIFLISTRAGGVGLNLIAADTVIFYEQDWNPQVDKQALQRAHRIGQLNHVLSIALVSEHSVEEVIMRRAENKLKLSCYVVDGEDDPQGHAEQPLADPGDLRSVMFGLHLFDPMDAKDENYEVNTEELNAMVERILEIRSKGSCEKDGRKFEINPKDLLAGGDLSLRSVASNNFDSEFDEASYLSWIEKFKEASTIDDLRSKACISDTKHVKQEIAKKKAEEKKLDKWEAIGYQSLAVQDPEITIDSEIISDSGSVQFVYGDCTKPFKICPSEPAIIFSCIDNSGTWGHGGMFDALADLSGSIPDAYYRAYECRDLHMGDLHLIKINGGEEKNTDESAPLWVALAVTQSYNPRRKVPRSNISIPDLEKCLSKASFSAAQNSASIHMPRIGYQDGSDRSLWYTVERVLRKYASIYSIKIFVYYYRRQS